MVVAVTGQEWALAAIAALFILFAAASSFWLPRRDPGFPGERLPLFLGATVVLFLVMIGGVWAFAGAGETEGAHEERQEQPTTGAETTAETTPATTAETTTEEGGDEQAGDPGAGEDVFASAGCGGCHTLEAANASGGVGPNLDETQPDFARVVQMVTEGSGAMPSFRDQLSEQQIRDVAAFVSGSAGS